jgi:hypothetical protein
MYQNNLWGMRAYLIGPMDRVADGGVGWRRDLTPFLEAIGVVVLDPTKKPIAIGCEDIEKREYRNGLKQEGRYNDLAKEVRVLRVVDLRMCDMSDFLVAYINTDIHMCGSYEELSWCNRMKRPILCMVEGGKQNVPDWLLGVLPHEHIFGSWDDIKDYLKNVDSGADDRSFKRWMFFDYTKMLPTVPPSNETLAEFSDWICDMRVQLPANSTTI